MKKPLLFVSVLCTFIAAGNARADVCGAVANNLVSNCGFETGTFADWTLTGAESSPAEEGLAYGVDQADAHSGEYGAYLSGFGGVLSLNQTLETTPGTTYTVTYWLAQSPATVLPYQSSFTASFGGKILGSLSQVPDLPFTEYSATATASSTTALLSFGFRDDTGYFSIDDIVVTPAAPEPGSLGYTFLGVTIFQLCLVVVRAVTSPHARLRGLGKV